MQASSFSWLKMLLLKAFASLKPEGKIITGSDPNSFSSTVLMQSEEMFSPHSFVCLLLQKAEN